MNWFFESNSSHLLSKWNYFGFLLQGISGIGIFGKSMQDRKYFVSWNEKEFHYFLPKTKQPDLIKIQDIKSLEINWKEIVIELVNNEIRRINLNYFFYQERKKIQEYFTNVENNLKKSS